MARKRRETARPLEDWNDPMAYKGPLRTAKGNRGIYQGGSCFGFGQDGTIYDLGGPFAGIEAQMAVVPLNNGTWLASPPGLFVWSPQFPSRDAALRAAAAGVIRRMRMLARPATRRYGYRVTREHAEAVIAWALNVVGRPPRKLYVKPPPPDAPGKQLSLFTA